MLYSCPHRQHTMRGVWMISTQSEAPFVGAPQRTPRQYVDAAPEGNMITCTMCRKQIDQSEMTSRSTVLERLGVSDVDDSSLDNMFRAIASATQAWKCSRCN